jgi:hypothetical protein
MGKIKRVIKTPYQHLKEDFNDFATQVCYRHTVNLGGWDKNNLDSCKLSGIYHKAQAAEDLGYELVVKTTKDRLDFYYVKKVPEFPVGV